ncbi:CaiB/BaiF CoA transferase family protein [Thermodesulfobacteriota bacterium]
MDLSLEGVKIIQTATAAAGPMSARLLADLGADVIVVEHTARKARMAQMRAAAPGGRHLGKRVIISDIPYEAQNNNRNKRNITLNLASDEGREILYKLLETADVFLANFRQRELTKFKLEYETLSKLNPRLICAHLTGFGRKGPDRDAPGFGTTAGDSRSGFIHVIKEPEADPAQMPMSFADSITGLALSFGIMTALYLREKTGVGQEVDASLFNAMSWTISHDVAGSLVTGKDRHAYSRKERAVPLTNPYKTKDGRWLYIMLTANHWPRLCKAIGREDLESDPRFEELKARGENHLALFDILTETFMSKTLEEWDPILNKADLPWSRVQTLPEVINDPQARANNFFLPMDHPTHGRIEVMTGPVKLSKTPDTIRMPAPDSGQHNEEILTDLGYTKEDIARFLDQGVIA